MSKLILVLGATGAQGRAVVNSLLAPSQDGTPSPYSVRALSRDPEGKHALSLRARGVQVFKAAALDGVYGAWINIDGFTVGEQREIYAGIRIFELAKQTKSLRHYVWSSLDYNLKKGGYNQKYRCEHYDAKGRIAEWLSLHPSVVSDTELSWSVVTSGPYMEMLNIGILGPVQRDDGTFVFNSPIGDGHIPLIALEDLGFFARYTFDHRAELSGKNLEIASDWVGWEYLVESFTKATGHKAEYNRETLDVWLSHTDNADKPVAAEGGAGSTSWAENFTGWWNSFRDDLNKRDMEWLRKTNPNGFTVEKWIRENNYDGILYRNPVLKIVEDGKSLRKRRS
ncbi:NAD-P-binding protein [Multifurca ochricompacta]|uniref:NAD-P-binding protein n=1 Tax=Multifurca ochricompacta TaxID=376703 RepID=A0AAD4QPZ1_9AGAM|nr:NAD-P-binding protein [Multifurca ochricompacta]